MKKLFILFVAIVSTVFSLSSCLGDDEEYTYYDDVVITGFSLGTLNRYYHKTTTSGADSIYKRTLNCSSYTFYIDQAKGEIWNPDSLPVEIDPSAVVCTITTKNSATAYLKSLTSDSLTAYSSSDSIDFSNPRTFRVINYSSTAYKDYTIKVNVHKEVGDSCIWTKVLDSEASLGRLSGMRALANNGKVYVFGYEGTTTKIYSSAESDGMIWEEVPTAQELSTDVYKNVVLMDGTFFALSNGKILKSTDVMNWQEMASVDFRQLVASSSKNLYAISNDGKMMKSTDEGATWAEDQIDEDASLLPYENITSCTAPLQTNANADKIVLFGTRSLTDYPSDVDGVVWTKVDEFSAGSRNHAWNYVATNEGSKYNAPRLKNFQMVSYDNEIIAIGGKGIGGNTTEAFSQIYRSGDAGITWKNDSVMSIPSDLNVTNGEFAFFAGSNNTVWIICGGSGMVQKGRINRLLWKKE